MSNENVFMVTYTDQIYLTELSRLVTKQLKVIELIYKIEGIIELNNIPEANSKYNH